MDNEGFEDLEERVALTHEQKLAFTALKKSIARCKKEDVYLFKMLDHIHAVNGNEVLLVNEDMSDYSINNFHVPYTDLYGGNFADEDLYIVFK
jgi:hypothetical protein